MELEPALVTLQITTVHASPDFMVRFVNTKMRNRMLGTKDAICFAGTVDKVERVQKTSTFLDKFGVSTVHFNISHNDNFEHCVCPGESKYHHNYNGEMMRNLT